MLIRAKDDWKQFLSQKDEETLNEILRSVQKYRHAYRSSKDMKIAQLWAAVLELHKNNERLKTKLTRMEYVFDGAADRIKKLQKDDEELIRSLDRF